MQRRRRLLSAVVTVGAGLIVAVAAFAPAADAKAAIASTAQTPAAASLVPWYASLFACGSSLSVCQNDRRIVMHEGFSVSSIVWAPPDCTAPGIPCGQYYFYYWS
jgi:hypothetical protein